MIMSAASVVVASCAKEVVETTRPAEGNETVGGEGVTFTAYIEDDAPVPSSSETKVAIGIDETSGKAKVSFTAGDFVAVYDGKTIDRITLKAENINPDGSATFKAPTVSATAESYLAYVSDKNTLGSFDENHVYTNVKNSDNPNDFVEIASGRTPHAAFASCGRTDRRLSFKNMLTLLKFKVSTEGVSYVEFRGNNNENVTGKVVGTYSTGEAKLVEFNTETNCFAVAKTFVSALNTDCYITLAPGLTLSNGFTVTAYDATGSALFSSKSDKVFTTAAGKLWDLGTLEEHKMTPYDMWMAGQDIEIGGKMYNKAEYPLPVTRVTKDMSNVSVNGSGIWFIDSDASVSVGGYHRGSVIVVGNTVGTKSKINLSSGSYIRHAETREHHVIAFKNMEITSTGGGEFLPGTSDYINQGYPNEKGTVVIDDCFITLNKNFVKCDNANGTNRGVLAGLTVVNSNICVTANEAALFNSWNGVWDTSLEEFSLTVKNNIVWSNDGHKVFFFVAGLNGGVGVWPFKTLIMENNTLYNVHTGVVAKGRTERFTLGLATADKVSGEFIVKNNMFYTSEATSDDRFFTITRIKSEKWPDVKSKVSASGNWCDHKQMCFCYSVNVEGDESYWRYSTTFVDNTGETKTNPFESFDVTTGAFRMKSGYMQYGAQR